MLSRVPGCSQDLIAAEDRFHVFIGNLGIGTTARPSVCACPRRLREMMKSENQTERSYQSRRLSSSQCVTSVMLTRTNVGLQEVSIRSSIRPLGRNGSAAAAQSAVATATNCVRPCPYAPREQGSLAERNGITSVGKMDCGRQLSPEVYEPREGIGWSGQKSVRSGRRNRAHEVITWDESYTLLRLLRQQIIESRQPVVTC